MKRGSRSRAGQSAAEGGTLFEYLGCSPRSCRAAATLIPWRYLWPFGELLERRARRPFCQPLSDHFRAILSA